jgi:hypothetical protein
VIKPSEVVDLAKKYFGPIPARESERPAIPNEPSPSATRTTNVRAPAQVPYLLMAYHVPVHTSAGSKQDDSEPYALAVLSGVLDGGQSARFERELVREQKVAVRAGAGYDAIGRAPTLFLFDGTPAAGKTVQDLEQRLRAQVERIKKEPISAEELARVKAQVCAMYSARLGVCLKRCSSASCVADERLTNECSALMRCTGTVSAVTQIFDRFEFDDCGSRSIADSIERQTSSRREENRMRLEHSEFPFPRERPSGRYRELRHEPAVFPRPASDRLGRSCASCARDISRPCGILLSRILASPSTEGRRSWFAGGLWAGAG